MHQALATVVVIQGGFWALVKQGSDPNRCTTFEWYRPISTFSHFFLDFKIRKILRAAGDFFFLDHFSSKNFDHVMDVLI